MVGLVKVPSSHIRAVPCISGIRHKPLPKAALWLDGNPLVQVLLGPPPHEAIVRGMEEPTHSQIVPWWAVRKPWNRSRISDPEDPWVEDHCETHATLESAHPERPLIASSLAVSAGKDRREACCHTS